jgi:stage II sporulation protein D
MRSTSYAVGIEDDHAIFRGKGWGHGVGLCQWGALGQALLGRHHDDILRFYYPESEITELQPAGAKSAS